MVKHEIASGQNSYYCPVRQIKAISQSQIENYNHQSTCSGTRIQKWKPSWRKPTKSSTPYLLENGIVTQLEDYAIRTHNHGWGWMGKD